MKIALLTSEKLPDLTSSDQLLIPEFKKYAIIAEPVIWDNRQVDWMLYDYLIFRNTWDYFEKEKEFNLWLDEIEKLGVKTLNPVDVIKQNKHKFYLRDMEKLGCKIIPTLFVDKTDNLNLSEIIPRDWEKVIIKPAFSAGSYQTELFDCSSVEKINKRYLSIASEKELLVQKFIPEIQTLGETSFIFFNKKYSHCVNKKPDIGDFRVQSQFGGLYEAIEPTTILIEKAQRVVETFEKELLYARVDGIIIEEELYLMEVECIEPDLYFNLSEGAIQKFVKSTLELIQ
jgi:glutathione synthase/RimK-type ligase-like ATP-grasp enzyme